MALPHLAIDQAHRIRNITRRFIQRRQVEKTYRQIIAGIDLQEFEERFGQYWGTPKLGYYKFSRDYDLWLRKSISRYFFYDCDKLKPASQTLDIGCGPGYFMIVCRHFGCSVTGLDLDSKPMFNEMIEFFGLHRIAHRIEPFEPLSLLPASYNLVTAFMTQFNQHADGRPWGGPEWKFLIEDLRQYLADEAAIVLKFNTNSKSGTFYPPEVRSALAQLPGFKSSFFRDSLRLSVV